MDQKLSIIIPAYNEAKTLPYVLTSCKELKPYEIIVVANGCTDNTEQIAIDFGCKVIHEKYPLGHDIGRALGAAKATGDILLFLDADFTLSPQELKTFLKPILKGRADVVLNDLDWIFNLHQEPHNLVVWRQVFNIFTGMQDLKIDGLTEVPNALTKEAIHSIGLKCLAKPPMATINLLKKGWRVAHDYAIDVFSRNRLRAEHYGMGGGLSKSEKTVIGDQLTALASIIEVKLEGEFKDTLRRYDIVNEITSGIRKVPIVYTGEGRRSNLYNGKRLSVIIPVMNEEATLPQVMKEVERLNPFEIIVVVNGSSDSSAQIAIKNRATTVVFNEPLGHDVGRAIGAKIARGDILLFIDGDIPIPSQDLVPYVKAIDNGLDIALNDLNYYLRYVFPLYPVTACKYALNLAMDRQNLAVGSMITIPHAVSRKTIEQIGWSSLTCPPLAYVKALVKNLSVASVHRVDVDEKNRIRPERGAIIGKYDQITNLVIGDHLRALQYFINSPLFKKIYQDDNRLWNKLKGLK